MESKEGVTVDKMIDSVLQCCVTSGKNEPWCGKSSGEKAMKVEKVEKLASALLEFELQSRFRSCLIS